VAVHGNQHEIIFEQYDDDKDNKRRSISVAGTSSIITVDKYDT